MRKLLTIAACSVFAVVSGCSKMPEAELAAAKSAVESAKQAQADSYATTEFQAASDALTAAMAEIEKQNSKSPIGRNYDQVKTMLSEVTVKAQEAQNNAASGKEAVKMDVEGALSSVTASITEAKDLLGRAPRGKEGKAALEAMAAEIAAIESSIASVATLIESQDFLAARDQIAAGSAKLDSIKTELSGAIDKTN